MTRYFNRASEKSLRRTLRSEMPPAEQMLWRQLRGAQVANQKFRRQYSVGPYVLDFYCPQLKLGIEVDGESHFQVGAVERDRSRQEYIERLGIRLIRFTNPEIYNEMPGVLETIEREIARSSPLPRES